VVGRRAPADHEHDHDHDGAALPDALADADGHADGHADADTDGHADADEVGVPGRYITPDRRTDGVAVGDRGADSLSRRLTLRRTVSFPRREAAVKDPRRGNKSVRILIMTVIKVMPVNVRRVSVHEGQRGSDDHA
jgi:hypothetical protein